MWIFCMPTDKMWASDLGENCEDGILIVSILRHLLTSQATVMRLFSVLLIALLIPSAGYTLSKDRPELSAKRIPLDLQLNAHQVVRAQERIFSVRDEDEGRLYESKAITILDKEAADQVLRVFYNNATRIRSLSVTLYDAQGRFIKESRKKDIRDYPALDGFSLYQDARYQEIELRHQSYPYTLVFEYEKHLSGIQFAIYPDWIIQGFGTSVETASFQLRLPVEMTFFKQERHFSGKYTSSTDSKEQVHTWMVSQQPALRKEPYSASSYQQLPMILISPDAFAIDGYRGRMDSWASYGRFMQQLFAGRDQLTPEVSADVQAMKEKAPNQSTLIDQLYRYMQKDVRYVSVQLGIGGWQPYDAEYVIRNKYGDCKALSNYMKALLAEAGITAYPVLIQRGENDYEVDSSFTHTRFNHMILFIPGQDLWLECTSNDYPAGYLGSDNADRNVLLITPDGGRIARTPALTEQENREEINVQVELAATGAAQLVYRAHLRGKPHEPYRYMLRAYSEEEKEKWLTRNVSVTDFSLHDFSMEASRDSATADIHYQGNSSRYAAQAGKRLFVPINALSRYGGVPGPDEHRQSPVVHKRAIQEDLTIEINLPKGYRIEALPAPQQFSSSVGTYRMQVEQKDRQVIIHRTVTFKARNLPAEEYNTFRDFYQQINDAERSQMVLVAE